MSRKSALSMRARGSFDTEVPFGRYFLSVGGMLLLLLFASDWTMPAPLPSRFMESRSALPTIRIHSDRKGPEAVFIDTSPREVMPMLAEKEIAAAPLLSSDVTDDVQPPLPSLSEPVDGSNSSSASSALPPSHLGEAFAQVGPALRNPADARKKRGSHTLESQRKRAQNRDDQRQRSARSSSFDTFRWCDPLSREQGSCRYAFMHPKIN